MFSFIRYCLSESIILGGKKKPYASNCFIIGYLAVFLEGTEPASISPQLYNGYKNLLTLYARYKFTCKRISHYLKCWAEKRYNMGKGTIKSTHLNIAKKVLCNLATASPYLISQLPLCFLLRFYWPSFKP